MVLYLSMGGGMVSAISFMAGLFLFKVKSRWCPECGAWTTANPSAGTRALAHHR
jgi:hypothetical protein